MSKKFLSDVLIECGLQVSGTTTLGTATATTVATSDNSTNIATTAWVKSLGYSTTDSYVSGVSLNGNLLSFTGVNSAFTGSIDLSSITSSFNASDVTTVYERVKNVSGDIIYKGTPLAVVAGQTSGNISDVIPADASDAGRMPAVFIANEDIAPEAEGEAVLFGNLTGVDTSLYESGTTVYVAPGGGWTATKPIYPNLIQNLGVITKQHPTNGGGIVTGVGRANALPNLTAGKIWVGTTNYPIESATVFINEADRQVSINGDFLGSGYIGLTSDQGGYLAVVNDNFDFRYAGGSLYANPANGFIRWIGQDIFWGSVNYGEIPAQSSLGFNRSGIATEFPSSTAIQIDPFGLVGIGTTSPNVKLSIEDSTTSATLGIKNTNTNGYSGSWLYNSAGTLVGHWGWANGTTTTLSDKMYFGTIANKDVVFTTNDSEKVRITAGGNVGIGTTSPTSPLHISSSTNKTILLDFVAAGNGSYTWASFQKSGGEKFRIWGDTQDSGTYLSFYNTQNSTHQLILSSNGNVGIGTTSPSEKLHVVGNVKIDNGSTSATLETTEKAADPAGAVYATYPTNSTYGAFVDYIIYDSGRDSMRAGTMRATWNANEVSYSDVSTVDIGDTSVVTMTAVLNGTDVDLVVTGDAVFTVKLNVKIIR